MNENLIPLFIFSLPRAGSTLTQRILAAHKDITTAGASEPSLLLPYLFSLKEEGTYAKYRHQNCAQKIEHFCRGLPNGVDDYLAEMRTFVLRLYARAAVDKKARFFVDKTPGYFLVVEDIIRLFPEGKFIFLWRNPLSVVASMTQTWTGGRWVIYQFYVDLFEGLPNLISAYKKYQNQVHVVRYEDLVTKPQETCQHLFAYLGIAYDMQVLSRFSEVRFTSPIRDPHMDLDEYQVLRQDTLSKWKTILANPLRKAWCRRCLRWIGTERLMTMGYDLDQLLAELDAVPLSLRFLGSDMWWMPYDIVYRSLEGRILKQRLQDLRAGRRLYAHL